MSSITEVKVGGITWSSTSDFDYDHGGRLYREQLTLHDTYQSTKSSKLQSIQDLSNHEAGFKPTALSYVYDNNGNITFEPQQQLSMTYNHINLPSAMQWPNGKKLETIYDASGKKWQQIKYDQDQNTQTRTYIAGMEFIGNTLELIAHSEGFIQNTNYGSQGRLMLSGPAAQDEQAQLITSTQQVAPNQGITYTAAGEVLMQDGFRAEAGAEYLAAIAPVNSTPSFQWRYAIRDHLGNTRVLFTDKNGDGLVRQSPDENLNEVLAFYKYAPFGLELSGSHQNGGQSNNRYRYNGKELEAATGFYEYGARWYDAAVGRFLGVDPLAEEYVAWSIYNYVMGNPISSIDPDGRRVENTIFLDSGGNEIGRTEDNLPDAIVVVSDENIGNFHQGFMRALLRPGHIGDDDVTNLRGYGDSYMVDGMNDVWNASMAVTLPPGSGGYVDASGNPITNLHPEAGSYFNVSRDGKTLTVDPDIYTSESTSAVGLGGDRPSVHSHPIHGGLYRPNPPNKPKGPAKEQEGPSRDWDYPNSYRRQRRNPSRYRDVVVGPNNIYLYKGYKDAGKVPRSFFKKD